MPRPNPMRSIGGEKALAARIAYEREEHGWTYAGLAARMTSVGCPIQASALYKIEKSDPPRGISVDELMALSRVFGLGLDDLVQPITDTAGKRLLELLNTLQGVQDERSRLDAVFEKALDGVRKFIDDWPEVADSLSVEGQSVAEIVKAAKGNIVKAARSKVANRTGDKADAEKDAREKRRVARANQRKTKS
jgi:transcriptional regulator with XRE-family HTH domain